MILFVFLRLVLLPVTHWWGWESLVSKWPWEVGSQSSFSSWSRLGFCLWYRKLPRHFQRMQANKPASRGLNPDVRKYNLCHTLLLKPCPKLVHIWGRRKSPCFLIEKSGHHIKPYYSIHFFFRKMYHIYFNSIFCLLWENRYKTGFCILTFMSKYFPTSSY